MSAVSITEAWPPAGQPFTVTNLDRMPEDGRRYELLAGALIVTPRPTTVHQLASARLVTTLSNANVHFSYAKGRTVSLSLVDYQVSEVHNSGFTFGGTWRKKGLLLPFKVPFTDKDTHRLDNDLVFKLDLSIINNSTSNSILDQNLTTPVAGNKTIKIDPSIDYAVNKKINVRFYYDKTRVIPYISSSPPTSLTRMGLEFKVSLSQ